MKMSHLLTLPPEVLEHHLFPFLPWNDLLRLRRVSTTFKTLVDGYVKVNPQRAPEIKIGGKETERNLRAFLDLGLPSTKIFLDNYRRGFYQENSEELSEFLKVYGWVVIHLRVDHFSLYCSGMERTFLEGLVNLQSFETVWFGMAKGAGVEDDMMLPVPRIFANLTVLKLQYQHDGDDNGDDDGGVNGVIKLLTACRKLEHFRPQSLLITPEPSTKLIRFLDAAIQQRKDNSELATLSKLKVIDFEFWNKELRYVGDNLYVQFLRTCAVHGILLQGVRADKCVKNFAINRGNLLMPIQSLVLSSASDEPYNWTWMMKTEMPNLENVWFSTCKPAEGIEDFLIGIEDFRLRRVCLSRSANWPMLKRLELVVLCGRRKARDEYYDCYVRLVLQEIQDLFRLLFEGISRTALRELKLRFHGEVGNDILNADSLTTCCPNLKKLELINWGGNNEQFVRLWQGLAHLEEVVLRDCSGLGIDGFIGPDAQNPAFFNLKMLRKLTLYEMNWNAGMIDNLFSSVIRHLNLTHFTITSVDPLKEKCFKLLLGGRFEKSIEKFSFVRQGRLGDGSTRRVNMMLQKLFAKRLSNML